MYCQNCGVQNEEGARYCKGCGVAMTETVSMETPKVGMQDAEIPRTGMSDIEAPRDGMQDVKTPTTKSGTDDKLDKIKYTVGIEVVTVGVLLFLIGFKDIEYDWGIISLVFGAGILASGILLLLKKDDKIIHIIDIVVGSITLFLGLISDLYFDWAYVGLAAGISLLVIGLLGLLCKSMKSIAVVETVFAGILLCLGLACIKYDWGIISMAAGISFLPEGVLKLLYLRGGKNS